MKKFKNFLLNEGRSYLGRRVNDVLTSMQEIEEDMPNLGTRHLGKLADEIVNQIRKILHSNWDVANHKHLKELQKIAVAIQKTIDEKGDLKEILPAATQSLQSLAGKLGIKVNDLSAPGQMDGEDITQGDFEETPPPPQDQGQMGQPPMGQPPMGQPPMPPMPPMGPMGPMG